METKTMTKDESEKLSGRGKAKAVAKLVAILLAFLLLSSLWEAGVEKVWGAEAAAAQTSADPSASQRMPACDAQSPCVAQAAKKKNKQLRAGKLGYTGNDIKFPKSFKKKAKAAYSRYVKAQGGRVAPRSVPGASARGYDWPSPREWFKGYADAVLCGFTGTVPGATKLYCGSDENQKMLTYTSELSNEVTRMTVKCSGNAILGGLSSEGAKETARKLGVKLSGGMGLIAGAGECAFSEYFDRWWW